MDQQIINKRIDSMIAVATLLLQEATKLREELGLVSARVPRKGSLKELGLMALAKRDAAILKKQQAKKV